MITTNQNLSYKEERENREIQDGGFITAKPIAKFYSVTEPTVYRWAKEGKIPCIRFQGTIRFNFAAVRSAIEA